MKGIYATVLALSAGALLLPLTGCLPLGGACAAVDNSRPIVAASAGSGTFGGVSSSLSADRDPLEVIAEGAHVTTGYISDPSCHKKPVYYITVADFIEAFAAGGPYIGSQGWGLYNAALQDYAQINGALSLSEDSVTFNGTLDHAVAWGDGGTAEPGVSGGTVQSVAVTGTFSAAAADAAMAQLYPRWRGPGELPTGAAALGIPVQWHFEAVIDGQTRELDRAAVLKLYHDPVF